MIPHAGSALAMLSQRILSHLVPNLATTYAMSDGAMTALLLQMLVAEVESGIERRLEDIEAMRAIFREAMDGLAVPQLPTDISTAVEQLPASMTLNDVNAVHDALTRVLIDLHARVDVDGSSPDQININRRIWSYLDESAERHKTG